jgi:competence protein ComEC
VLIDAGGSAHPRFDPGERVLLPYLDQRRVRRLDLLVASHGDVDHVGGAFAVLRELEIGELWLPPGAHRHPRLAALAALARERGAAVVLAERGHEAVRGGVPLRVLGPDRGHLVGSENDRSLVVLAGAPPARLLVAGDLERSGETRLLACGEDPAAEALIVGHHGSAGGTGASFLSRVGATHALISCGFHNRFGHPHPETLRRLRSAGAGIWRTDRQGLIRLVADARGWEVTVTRRSTRAESE